MPRPSAGTVPSMDGGKGGLTDLEFTVGVMSRILEDRSVLRSDRKDRPMVNAGVVCQFHEAAWYLVRKGGTMPGPCSGATCTVGAITDANCRYGVSDSARRRPVALERRCGAWSFARGWYRVTS
jgi:hypothetical protein